MSVECLYLGHPAKYWIELKRRTESELPLDGSSLITEIAKLRGQINFCKSRIKQMTEVTNDE